MKLAESGSLAVFVALWAVGLLKVAGGLLALAMVQPWGPARFPRWLLLSAGWGGSALLVLYGCAQIGAQLLDKTGVIAAPADMDWRGFYGHLYLWDPWFLLWGLLLGITTISYTRRSRRRPGQRRTAGPGSAHWTDRSHRSPRPTNGVTTRH